MEYASEETERDNIPNTIQMTMLLPTMAMKSMVPKKNVHSTFCSTEISYGRRGGDFKHSRIQLLAANCTKKNSSEHIVETKNKQKKHENIVKWKILDIQQDLLVCA